MDESNKQGRCPKCGGNSYIDKDHYGWYEQCLQCAFIRDLKAIYKNEKEAEFVPIENLKFDGEDE